MKAATQSSPTTVSAEHCAVTGPLVDVPLCNQTVRYRRVLSRRQRGLLAGFVVCNLLASLVYLGWLLMPAHLPRLDRPPGWATLSLLGFLLIAAIELTRIGNNAVIWLFAWHMRDPVPMTPPSGLRVAVLTTIVPAKEPLDVLERTLRAMRRLRYNGVVDVWVLDEGDDPRVQSMAARLGVKHFSRRGRAEYNQPSGAYRAKTKAGNHNAWRTEHERDYDVVAQMDPDHVPEPHFLQRSLGYFRDPDVAFVVAPQVYGNMAASFVAGGAADQGYLFEGVIQRGGNGLGAPLLIGTNHVYRVAAWNQIQGYQDSIIEDHLTSLTVLAATNPATGQHWRGVYTPDVLAIGEGPRTWTDYFNQQRRWSYGIWQVLLQHSPRLLPRLNARQRLAYLGLEVFYPSLGSTWLWGNTLTVLYLALGVQALRAPVWLWLPLWAATVVSQYALVRWLRRFNLLPFQRRGGGGNGLLLSMATLPVYAAAAVSAILRRPLTYVVTAKGDLASGDHWRTFSLHLRWLAVMAPLLVLSFWLGHDYRPLQLWGLASVAVCLLPVVKFWVDERRPTMLRQAPAWPRIPRGFLGCFVGILLLISLR